MASIQTVYLVSKSIPGGEKILGVLVDGDDLERLQSDESAMPVDTHLRAAQGAVVDGEVLVLGEPQIREALPVFALDAYHTKAAERDAAIAALAPNVRAEIAGSDWEPEATKIARRASEARAARDASASKP